MAKTQGGKGGGTKPAPTGNPGTKSNNPKPAPTGNPGTIKQTRIKTW